MHRAHTEIAATGLVSAIIPADIIIRTVDMGFMVRMDERVKMMKLIKNLKIAARNYARYIATRNEIARMPLDVALDLGIFRGDADKIARKAVWN
ncbi:hypothetical protein [Pseudorhodobacter sp.]|uniref:hypothetical protein n=1 Tax=Pseudorhodobacter sp. TaxID=1934400 RepID=UPI00264A1AFF|nr:hypothetical protein [Pseudorhodobacter sp.]MDN5788506.1 hypothetical protein [Pseudorhodobacter sp.]